MRKKTSYGPAKSLRKIGVSSRNRFQVSRWRASSSGSVAGSKPGRSGAPVDALGGTVAVMDAPRSVRTGAGSGDGECAFGAGVGAGSGLVLEVGGDVALGRDDVAVV